MGDFVTSLFKNMQSKGILFYFVSRKTQLFLLGNAFYFRLKTTDKHTVMLFVIWTTPFYFYIFWFFTFFFDILPPLENCCETVPSIFLNLSNLLSWGSWSLTLLSQGRRLVHLYKSPICHRVAIHTYGHFRSKLLDVGSRRNPQGHRYNAQAPHTKPQAPLKPRIFLL